MYHLASVIIVTSLPGLRLFATGRTRSDAETPRGGKEHMYIHIPDYSLYTRSTIRYRVQPKYQTNLWNHY